MVYSPPCFLSGRPAIGRQDAMPPDRWLNTQ